MDMKEKIKLLGDLQASVDNPEVQELLKNLPSGEKVFELFSKAVTSEIEGILSGNPIKATEKLSDLTALFQKLDNSIVVSVLRSVNEKLGAPSGVPVQQAPQVPRNEPEEAPESQDDMKRRWESQQLGAPQGSRRGGIPGQW
jgi:hypothetical protein